MIEAMRRRLCVAATILALVGAGLFACSNGSPMATKTTGTGGGGSAGTTGAGGQGGTVGGGGTTGAGGQGGVVGSAGTTGAGGQGGTVGSTGQAGHGSCTHGPVVTNCSADAGALPTSPGLDAPCTVESARCQGTWCPDERNGEQPFVEICCNGRWRNYVGDCPGPSIQPGDLFFCNEGFQCTAGRTYCSYANAERTASYTEWCPSLCPAGDCSCFCDKPGGCDFNPPGSACPADICRCSILTASNISLPGAVEVRCDYLVSGSHSCFPDPSVDPQCGVGAHAVACAGPATQAPAGCSTLPDAAVTASCGTEIHEFCCPR